MRARRKQDQAAGLEQFRGDHAARPSTQTRNCWSAAIESSARATAIESAMRSRRSREAGEPEHGAGDRQRQPRGRQREPGGAGVARERAGGHAAQRDAGRGPCSGASRSRAAPGTASRLPGSSVSILTGNAAAKFFLSGPLYGRMRLLLVDDHTHIRRRSAPSAGGVRLHRRRRGADRLVRRPARPRAAAGHHRDGPLDAGDGRRRGDAGDPRRGSRRRGSSCSPSRPKETRFWTRCSPARAATCSRTPRTRRSSPACVLRQPATRSSRRPSPPAWSPGCASSAATSASRRRPSRRR